MNTILQFIVLPPEVSPFEREYLRRMNRIATLFFVAHLPVFVAIAFFNDTGPWTAFLLTSAVLLGPLLAETTFTRPRWISVSHGVTSMLMGGLLVHFGQGPVQIEMHFYFFVLLALLAVFANPLAIVIAAATVALHHLIVWMLWPASVFNYDAPLWVVAVHAAFVVLEATAASFIARSFFDNVIGLEKIVQARTQEVQRRAQDMRRVLDTVDQGFLTIDRQGYVQGEYSAILDVWFGRIEPAVEFATILERFAPNTGAMFRIGWAEVEEDNLPLELVLAQLPHRVLIEGRILKLSCTPMVQEGRLEHALLVLTDVTIEIERERLEAEQRESLRIFDRIMRDKLGFLGFFEDASRLVTALTSEDEPLDLELTKRQIHTLKGNSSIFGIQTVADLCDQMEVRIAEDNELPSVSNREQLKTRWARLRTHLSLILGENIQSRLELADDQFESILRAVLDERPHRELAEMISQWKLEPTRKRMLHFGEQATNIAERLGKRLTVITRDHDVRLDRGRWSEFWSAFVHVVRNAVDHGIEDQSTRLAQGKAPEGSLEFETEIQGTVLTVRLRDDGRGIDWERVAIRAAKMHLPHETQPELEAALFCDGLSTIDEVTSLSGRGVGLAAVRQATESLGGTITVESAAGRGTLLEFRFPVATATVDPETLFRAA